MPFLNDEVKEWIALELSNLGVEDLAVYAVEAGTEGDERRVLVATEVGILDHRYAPFGSSARYRLAMLLYPWQVLRGVELRADTFRLWAMEHRTRWSFKLHYPHFEAATESPELGQALCDMARVCAVMAEPFGVPAGRSVGIDTAAAADAGGPSGAAGATTATTAAAIEVGGRAATRGPLVTGDGTGSEDETVAAEASELESLPTAAEPPAGGNGEPMGEAVDASAGEPLEDQAPVGGDGSDDESVEEQIGMVEMGDPTDDGSEGR